MMVHVRTRETVDTVISLLSTKLPVELALDIIELAEYYPYSIIGSRSGTSNCYFYLSTGTKTYLIVQIPSLDSVNSGEGDIQQNAGEQQREPRKRVVRKIVFRTSSHDQGYGGEAGCQGTYRGAFSWLSAEIWRRKTENYKKDMEAAVASEAKIIEANGGDIDDEGEYHHWCMHHGYTKIGEEEDQDESDDEYSEPDPSPEQPYDGEQQEEEEKTLETGQPFLQGVRKAKQGYYKVGSWVIQRNVCAKPVWTDHEIVWDATVDGPGPNIELWESQDGYKDENGQPMATGWLKNGRVNNSTFVKELREGDEVRVMLQAYFGGWSCTASRCEVECWWNL
ncbi:hypothetical protein TWF594_005949 [Orbilia oligospora]|nr:hypothetical protein TWF594_005949 [Orbilia oligospora]